MFLLYIKQVKEWRNFRHCFKCVIYKAIFNNDTLALKDLLEITILQLKRWLHYKAIIKHLSQSVHIPKRLSLLARYQISQIAYLSHLRAKRVHNLTYRGTLGRDITISQITLCVWNHYASPLFNMDYKGCLIEYGSRHFPETLKLTPSIFQSGGSPHLNNIILLLGIPGPVRNMSPFDCVNTSATR